jgi:hypothetical protein
MQHREQGYLQVHPEQEAGSRPGGIALGDQTSHGPNQTPEDRSPSHEPNDVLAAIGPRPDDPGRQECASGTGMVGMAGHDVDELRLALSVLADFD